MRSREAGVLPILNALIELQPSAPAASTDRQPVPLRALNPVVHPGSLIVTISDFQSLDAGHTGFIRRGSRTPCRQNSREGEFIGGDVIR
jgi:hypothetical protein